MPFVTLAAVAGACAQLREPRRGAAAPAGPTLRATGKQDPGGFLRFLESRFGPGILKPTPS